ncbi:hypothetical protein EJ03DRAFT_206755 [Teratosphaeria nubilosa]|uniref:Rhodopsin domain-containing protein n=1 Tax=Teratosphaeria nubilosa TaxID=161662 RepID=A0A6G1KXW9_9PEZI|nr:hypothetical protein EJ03DRAFT_206755 [Teratosphaeria nubilosa]
MVALVIESWIWYGFVLTVACNRFISRRMTLGSFGRFQLDDGLMMLVLCFYITLIATINIVANTNSNLLPPGYDIAHLSKADIAARTRGSKLILVVEQCQIASVWGAKTCLIIMYLRLTTLRRENIAIKVLAGYVAFGFVFMEVFYFAVWCRPFWEYWAVPTDSVQCDAATNHLITNAVFNLSSDCIMLAIGLPMFLRMQLPLKKKIPVVGMFSLGIFVILAAVLNKVYSFTLPFGSLWTYWYVRESSTALLVANLPFVWTFWGRVTGSKTSIDAQSRKGSQLPEVLSSNESKPRSKRRDGTWPVWDDEAGTGTEEVELGRNQQAEMTLADMLVESTRDDVDPKDVSPITHPGLFYSRDNTTKPVSDNKKEAAMMWQDSPDGSRSSETPLSSVFPGSLGRHGSIGSFV